MEGEDPGRGYRTGDLIGGRYRIRGMIGHGGMSEVFLVWDEKLEKSWAMKTVGKECRDNGRLCYQSMAAEISLLRRLLHPGLPRIIDVIDDGNNLSVVMDYIEGETLLDIVRRDGPQDQDTAVGWALQLTEVLDLLHGQDPPVIYRDMKPGNVMLCPDGRLVLFDFGIAREYKVRGTEDTVCLGTVGYAAPEQFGGRGQTDVRTDIYGLGATLYHLVTGQDPAQPPYEMVPVRRIRKELSSGLEQIILKCTKPNPEERYRNCKELTEALRNYRNLDEAFLRNEKKKLSFFTACVILSAGLTVSGVLFGAKLVRDTRRSYAHILGRAADLAAGSLVLGSYNQEVVDRYLEAADLFPGEKEAYFGVLDYCCDIGKTGPAMTAVCARIDSGRIRADRAGDLLYRVAELWFSGNEADPGFRKDYRKAARYFSMIDREEYPEAEECAELASALGVFGRDVNWNEVEQALERFAGRCADAPPGRTRIRNLILGAEIYTANRFEFQHIGVSAQAGAEKLWRMALEGAEELLTEGQDTEDLKIRAMKGLAGILSLSKETAPEAAVYYSALRECTSGEEQRRIRFAEVDAVMMAENTDMVKSLFDLLIRDYPKDREAYLRYCTWLIESGNISDARTVWNLGMENCDLSGGANFEELRRRTAVNS